MKARELTQDHAGWYVEAGYAKGLLQHVTYFNSPEGSQIFILVLNKNEGVQGITVDGDVEITAQKTLEEQLKDDVSVITNYVRGWLERKLK